ncbi:MAG: glycosyltransferase involved in cell wall biosynthesis [Crocinitomicaceae bacterium]|jgi:glycosyltransferase involved in cell wall biosynthesis
MRIAINTRFLLSHKMEGFGWYTFEIVKRLVENHPEHEFILFFDRKYDPKFVFGKNATPVVISPQARHPILFKIWFDFSIKRALKKYKADLFFSPDGYLSLTSDIKQVGVIHDLNFEHYPEDMKPVMRKYYLNNFPKFAKLANHIITVSEYSKQDICSKYSLPQDKVTAIWNGASEVFKPVDSATRSEIQVKYSDGKPYFLFVGAIHPRKNLQRLIPAFEKYKLNNPESDYQLVIVGTELWSNSGANLEIDPSVKAQIHFTGHLPLDQLARVVASATVFAFVPYFEGFGIPLVEAMQSGTPVLSGNQTSLPEVAGDAALYCDPFSIDDICQKLTILAHDEKFRSELSQKGLERAKLFSWDRSAEKVWSVLESVLNND